jgi:hypothetical protein
MPVYPRPAAMEEVTLVDVVDTALDKGVVVQGDATVSVADVDLVFLGLKLVLASVETMQSWRKPAAPHHEDGDNGSQRDVPQGNVGSAPRPGSPATSVLQRESEGHSLERGRPALAAEADAPRGSAHPALADPDKVEQGLAKLVLTVVELLRQLLERQALRRMESKSLTDAEIERMGVSFQRLAEKMEQLRRVFGLEGKELNLNLGPLGNLI